MSDRMKVRRSSGPSMTPSAIKAHGKEEIPKITFSEILADHNDEERRKQLLQQLLDEVDEKGKELVENRTVESLYEYKNMVKRFIEEAVEVGLKINERRGFGRQGRNKILRVVENVDEKLLQLTDLVLQKESKHINILSKVGEIKGLLVNIYL